MGEMITILTAMIALTSVSSYGMATKIDVIKTKLEKVKNQEYLEELDDELDALKDELEVKANHLSLIKDYIDSESNHNYRAFIYKSESLTTTARVSLHASLALVVATVSSKIINGKYFTVKTGLYTLLNLLVVEFDGVVNETDLPTKFLKSNHNFMRELDQMKTPDDVLDKLKVVEMEMLSLIERITNHQKEILIIEELI